MNQLTSYTADLEAINAFEVTELFLQERFPLACDEKWSSGSLCLLLGAKETCGWVILWTLRLYGYNRTATSALDCALVSPMALKSELARVSTMSNTARHAFHRVQFCGLGIPCDSYPILVWRVVNLCMTKNLMCGHTCWNVQLLAKHSKETTRDHTRELQIHSVGFHLLHSFALVTYDTNLTKRSCMQAPFESSWGRSTYTQSNLHDSTQWFFCKLPGVEFLWNVLVTALVFF